MKKSHLFLFTALSFCFVLTTGKSLQATEVKAPEKNKAEAKKTIEVPVYTKDDVIFQQPFMLKKADKTPVNGILQRTYPNGKIEAKAFFFNGLPHGESVTFYENGQTKTIEKYNQGRLHGKSVSYYDNVKIGFI